MRRFLFALFAFASLLGGGEVRAQDGCSYIVYGAVLTVGQWQACFQAKQNTLGYAPVNRAGDTMTGKLTTFGSSAGSAGFNLPTGTAPSSPTDGDVWITAVGMFAQVNGGTVGPFGTGGVGGGVSAITAGTGLSGGTITTSGTIAIAAIAADRLLLNATGASAVPTGQPIGNCGTALTYSTGSHAFGCNASVGNITSVANSDGSLTISPTTGAVVASINPAFTNTWSAIQHFTGLWDVTLNQNAITNTTITNTNTGVSALAGQAFFNSADNSFVGVAGTGYTAIPLLQSRGFFTSGPSLSGLVIDARGTTPIIFGIGDAEVGRWDSANPGMLRVGVPGTTQGGVNFASNVGSGTVTAGASNGTTSYNFFWPTALGAAGTFVTSGGNGAAHTYDTIAAHLAGGTGISITGTTTATVGLAAIAADNLLANATGGSAAPTATPIGNCTNALTYNTSTHAFGCNTIAGTGTVTSVAAGTGLTASPGSPITSSGTLSLANTAVTPGSYTSPNLTIDQQGRITAASNVVVNTRELLSANRTYFVGTDGNDACNGLTNAGGSSGNCAFATFAHAMVVITGQIDFGSHAVTLQCRAAHCSYGTRLVVTPWIGGGSFIFDGGGGTINYTSSTTSADAAILITGGALPGSFTFQNVTLQFAIGTAPDGGNMLVLSPALVFIGSGVTFGPCAGGGQIYLANGGANFLIQNSFTVSSGGCLAMINNNAGLISTGGVSVTVTYSAAATYSFTVLGGVPSFTYLGTMHFTNPGNVTATNFRAARNGVVSTSSGNGLFFPGTGCSVISSCITTGGQYD